MVTVFSFTCYKTRLAREDHNGKLFCIWLTQEAIRVLCGSQGRKDIKLTVPGWGCDKPEYQCSNLRRVKEDCNSLITLEIQGGTITEQLNECRCSQWWCSYLIDFGNEVAEYGCREEGS